VTRVSSRTRVLLLTAAAMFFVWQNVAFTQWLSEQDSLASGLAHAWRSLLSDRLVLLIWTDMGVFALAAIAWFARDLRGRGYTPMRRAMWLIATIILGCPPFLVYLAFRTDPQPPGGLAAAADARSASADPYC
jgi:hypothetical protein